MRRRPELPPIQIILEDILRSIGMSDFNITLESSAIPGHVSYNITGSESGLLIGRDGKNLQALSKLAREVVVARSASLDHHYELENFIIDVDNYQEAEVRSLIARIDALIADLGGAIDKVELDPMSPFHRRIVHAYVQEKTDYQSESTGVGLERRVVIFV